MRMIGILGGMSAASTALYYDMLCAMTRERLGGVASPELLIRSVDFAPIAAAQAAGEWAALGERLNAEAKALERGGAEILILATNTMHKLADAMLEGVALDFIHIADATAAAVRAAGFSRPGLMATAFTMEQSFYLDRLRAHGLDPLVPEAADRAETHRIIYEELCRAVTTEPSRARYEAIAARLKAAGADALILGCTEVGMLLKPANTPLPCFDSAEIHCRAALDAALTR